MFVPVFVAFTQKESVIISASEVPSLNNMQFCASILCSKNTLELADGLASAVVQSYLYDLENISQEFVKKYQIDKNMRTSWGDIYEPIKYIMQLSKKNNDYKLFFLLSY